MRGLNRTEGCCIALSAIFLAGCHHAPIAANPFLGDWTLTAPILGQGSISFSDNQFTERWETQSYGDKSALVISGPYELSGNSVHLDPKTFMVQGKSQDMLQMIQDDLQKARAWDFKVSWSTNDLAYFNAESSSECTVSMAITRNGVKPNMGKLAFVFASEQNPSTMTFEGGSQEDSVSASQAGPAPQPPQLATPTQPATPAQNQTDSQANSQPVTIVTGDAPLNGDSGQDQNATQDAQSQPPQSEDSTPANTAPNAGG